MQLGDCALTMHNAASATYARLPSQTRRMRCSLDPCVSLHLFSHEGMPSAADVSTRDPEPTMTQSCCTWCKSKGQCPRGSTSLSRGIGSSLRTRESGLRSIVLMCKALATSIPGSISSTRSTHGLSLQTIDNTPHGKPQKYLASVQSSLILSLYLTSAIDHRRSKTILHWSRYCRTHDELRTDPTSNFVPRLVKRLI
jgi:hypothetical protein